MRSACRRRMDSHACKDSCENFSASPRSARNFFCGWFTSCTLRSCIGIELPQNLANVLAEQDLLGNFVPRRHAFFSLVKEAPAARVCVADAATDYWGISQQPLGKV